VKVVVVGRQRASVSGHSSTVAAVGRTWNLLCSESLWYLPAVSCPRGLAVWRLRMEWTAARAPKRVPFSLGEVKSFKFN
jgi:hypothetical protein